MTANKELYLEVFAKAPILAAVDRQRLMNLYDRCELRTASAGEFIIREDTFAEEIYIVLSGDVSIQLHRGGAPVEVARMGPGSCLGETSVIGIQHRSADVQAASDAIYLVLTRSVLMKLYSEDIQLFALLVLNIARELARRLKDADHFIEVQE